MLPEFTRTGPPIVELPAPIVSDPFTIFRIVDEFVVRLSTESLVLELWVMVSVELRLIVTVLVGPGTPLLQFELVSQSPPFALIQLSAERRSRSSRPSIKGLLILDRLRSVRRRSGKDVKSTERLRVRRFIMNILFFRKGARRISYSVTCMTTDFIASEDAPHGENKRCVTVAGARTMSAKGSARTPCCGDFAGRFGSP